MSTELDNIAAGIAECERCPLHLTRNKTVPGTGRADADVMIIGEAPGQNEDRQGRPFVGASGKYMDQLLRDAGINREELFVTNVVKCRPPGDRDPTPTEKAECRPWLEAQIAALKPGMIVTLGAAATRHFRPDVRITDVRAKPLAAPDAEYLILPMYHPAAAGRREAIRHAVEDEFPRIREWMLIMREDTEARDSRDQADPTEQRRDEGTDRPTETLVPVESTPPNSVRRPDSAEPDTGILLASAKECAYEMRALWDAHAERNADPRKTRQKLAMLSAVCGTLTGQVRQLPQGEYRDWCEYRVTEVVETGRALTQSVPLICEECGQPFHASTRQFRPERRCAECRER